MIQISIIKFLKVEQKTNKKGEKFTRVKFVGRSQEVDFDCRANLSNENWMKFFDDLGLDELGFDEYGNYTHQDLTKPLLIELPETAIEHREGVYVNPQGTQYNYNFEELKLNYLYR